MRIQSTLAELMAEVHRADLQREAERRRLAARARRESEARRRPSTDTRSDERYRPTTTTRPIGYPSTTEGTPTARRMRARRESADQLVRPRSAWFMRAVMSASHAIARPFRRTTGAARRTLDTSQSASAESSSADCTGRCSVANPSAR